MIIRSKAPLRISFGGGGTDVSPYREERGGVALSVTIDKYAYCTLRTRNDDVITAKSLDYHTTASYKTNDIVKYDGNLDLVKAASKVLGAREGLDLFLHSDMPPGSGLGASSVVTVALVGVFKHYQRLSLNEYQIAELAYQIERKEVGITGGSQDQYAATFGGFNFIEFSRDKVIVHPLRIKLDTLNELEYRLLLCNTGKTRLSAGVIDDQVRRYIQREQDTVKALDDTKSVAIAMKNALLLGQIDEFGSLMNETWQCKKKFSPLVSDSHIDEMYDEARKSGALGGKLLGAGAGGYLLLLCEFDKHPVVAENLEKLGGKITNFAFEFRGLQTWEVNTRV